MEDLGKVFVGWEEVVVSKDKGRRVVHYYLRDDTGGMDLAVVGREKSARHMSYAVPGRFLRSLHALRPRDPLLASSSSSSPSSSFGRSPSTSSGLSLKWRSRREVVDWLSSLVSDSIPYGSSMIDRVSEEEVAEATDIPTSKGLSSGKTGHHSKEFTWLGSTWNCRKRRKHYQSFCRNGVTISVHDFVYVMTEENKRLVAYVEDLYEDLRANNMVVVRWFHKVDEVGILLSPNVNDREIFFSLCLQDFSIECIDGLAAVLSAQHFEKFQNEATCSNWEPYLCRRQIDNDDVKPFDITQLQGYWSQGVVRSMFPSSLKLRLKITSGGSSLDGGGNGQIPQSGLKKKHRLSSGAIDFSGLVARDMNEKKVLGSSNRVERHISSTTYPPGVLRKELFKHQIQYQISPGCHVEVLSQDSGMRGCWFRCEILKRHHDKVKVRYHDVQDADGNGNLEEWVLLSRVAAPDKLGIRLCGRPMVRPHPSERGRLSCSFDIGAVVDAWWHDGWWEGIVFRKEPEGQIHVYFPGEKRVSIFSQGDLRPSHDWINNKWNHITDRKDIVSSLFSDMERENQASFSAGGIPVRSSEDTNRLPETEAQTESLEPEGMVESKLTPHGDSLILKADWVLDLAKDCHHLDGLKWYSSKKRKRRGSASHGPDRRKRQCEVSSNSSSREEAKQSCACGVFMLPKSLTVDHDNCKIGGDPLFGAPMALSSLVMSR